MQTSTCAPWTVYKAAMISYRKETRIEINETKTKTQDKTIQVGEVGKEIRD